MSVSTYRGDAVAGVCADPLPPPRVLRPAEQTGPSPEVVRLRAKVAELEVDLDAVVDRNARLEAELKAAWAEHDAVRRRLAGVRDYSAEQTRRLERARERIAALKAAPCPRCRLAEATDHRPGDRIGIAPDRPLADFDGKPIPLSPNEWVLLGALRRARGRLAGHRELIDATWPGMAWSEESERELHHRLRVNLCRLRQKLVRAGAPPTIIANVLNTGWELLDGAA